MPPFQPTDVYDRFLFNTREQVVGEPVDIFVLSLQTLFKNCKYEGASDEHLDLLVRDRFIIGMRDKNVQYDLLQYASGDLSLEKAVAMAKQQEEVADVNIKTEAPDDEEPSVGTTAAANSCAEIKDEDDVKNGSSSSRVTKLKEEEDGECEGAAPP